MRNFIHHDHDECIHVAGFSGANGPFGKLLVFIPPRETHLRTADLRVSDKKYLINIPQQDHALRLLLMSKQAALL